MYEDSIPEGFEKLEDRVEQLVQTCHDLQLAKSGLEAKISDLEDGLRKKVEVEQKYMKEKSMIRSRIDDLLGRLDGVLDTT